MLLHENQIKQMNDVWILKKKYIYELYTSVYHNTIFLFSGFSHLLHLIFLFQTCVKRHAMVLLYLLTDHCTMVLGMMVAWWSFRPGL